LGSETFGTEGRVTVGAGMSVASCRNGFAGSVRGVPATK
jgi:hypothetical protein